MDLRLDDNVSAALRAALATSATPQFVADPDGAWVLVNMPLCDLIDAGPTDPLGDGWIASVLPMDQAETMSAWWRSTQMGHPVHQSFRCRDSGGRVTSVRMLAETVRGPSGEVIAWVGSWVVPDRSKAWAAAAEGFLHAALSNSSDLVVVIDRDHSVSYVSDASRRMLGLVPSDWVGRDVLELIHPDDLGVASESLVNALLTGSGVKDPVELRVRHADGRWREVEVVGNNLLDDPTVAGVLLNVRDVSDRRTAQRQELRARGQFEQAFQRSPIGMALTTLEGDFVRVNQALSDLLGRSSTELLATSVLEVTHPDDVERTVRSAVELLEGNAPSFAIEKRFLDAHGEAVWTRSTVTLLRGDDEEPMQFLTQIEDVADRRDFIEQLRRSALVDPLTRLANRAGLDEYLAGLRPETEVAVLALDLDSFKGVNDSSGHAAGDEVLRVVATRIAAAIRPGDQAARVGGDEFLVVCASPGSGAWARSLADRLVERIHQPIGFDGAALVVGASAGVAVGAAGDAESLLRAADRASYLAKRGGGNAAAAVDGDPDLVTG